jgi:hypothetical protein
MFRVLNSFAAAVDCNAVFAAKRISLYQIVYAAALNTPTLLVFQLLLYKPIQVTAPKCLSSIKASAQNSRD